MHIGGTAHRNKAVNISEYVPLIGIVLNYQASVNLI